MMWLDDLREELRRGPVWESLSGDGSRPARPASTGDEIVARADALVRTLLDQMNQALLGGRGSVSATPTAWGVYLWELWWEPRRERGPYLVVTLLRDSRGTPYLRVQGRRLALEDTRLERRLQRALRAAFLAPRVYTPRLTVVAEALDPLRLAPPDLARAGDGGSYSRQHVPPASPHEASGNGGYNGAEQRPAQVRTRRRTGRDDS